MTAVPDSIEISLWYAVAFEEYCGNRVFESSLPEGYEYVEHGDQILGFIDWNLPGDATSLHFRRVWLDRPEGDEWWKFLPIRGWVE